MMMVMAISAKAMSYNAAKQEALFLSDKMAYELNLSNAQYDDVYEINLDYLMSVNVYNDAYGKWWNRRNNDLKYVLTAYQYEKYLKLNYFYRPLSWEKGAWSFSVYNHYKNKNHFYKSKPKGYSSYKGGNNKKSDRFYADRNSSKASDNIDCRLVISKVNRISTKCDSIGEKCQPRNSTIVVYKDNICTIHKVVLFQSKAGIVMIQLISNNAVIEDVVMNILTSFVIQHQRLQNPRTKIGSRQNLLEYKSSESVYSLSM